MAKPTRTQSLEEILKKNLGILKPKLPTRGTKETVKPPRRPRHVTPS